MEAFGIYSLKAGIILTLFLGIYLLFLQKETFCRFNRGFLLTGLMASLFLPLIIIRYTVEISAPAIAVIEIETIPVGTTDYNAFITLCIRLLPVVYLTGLVILLIVRFIGLAHICISILQNTNKHYADCNVIESSEFNSPFSFFRFVFLPQHVNEVAKNMILKHEKTHIRQRHWIDLLLTNMLSLLWWFNPVIWLYGKAIRNNHEYLADQDVLIDYQQDNYQHVLLNQYFKTSVFPITNSFSYTNHLKRIKLMKKNISNPFKKLYTLLTVPALTLFLLAFSEKVYMEEAPNKSVTIFKNTSIVDRIDPEATDESLRIIDDKEFSTREDIQGEDVEETTLTIRGRGNSQTVNKPLIIVDGKEVSNTKNLKANDIGSITILKDALAMTQYGEKGKNGVILIDTKRYAVQEAQVEQQRIVNEQQKAETEHQQAEQSVNRLQQTSNNSKPSQSFTIRGGNGKEPLYFVDGKEVSRTKNLKAKDIESIEMLKGGSATTIYGERGYNGVILITTKAASRKN